MEKIKDKRFLATIALAIVAVAILASWRGASAEFVYPVDRARVSLVRRVGAVLAGLFRSVEVAVENRRLRCEAAELALAQSEVVRLAAENDRLRAALDFTARVPGAWIAAEVLSTGGGAAGVRRIVRLSKGSKAGIVRGAAVVVSDGLVGRVSAVTPHTCEVTLVTDPAVRVACEIEAGPGIRAPRGILCGDEGETLPLRYLTRAGGLSAARQRVITSGLGGVFPRGLVVGSLVGLDGSEGSVQLAADLDRLEYLFVRREN